MTDKITEAKMKQELNQRCLGQCALSVNIFRPHNHALPDEKFVKNFFSSSDWSQKCEMKKVQRR